ncbi:MAG: putative immunity protein [Saccharofermentanales bacterium]
MRKLLVTPSSECLQPIAELVKRQKHKTLVLWTTDYAGRVLPIFERKYPLDVRPRLAIEAAKAWSQGDI